MKRVIGITGQTGGGKSMLCSLIQSKFDATIIDCDRLTREIENKEYILAVSKIFGNRIIKDGKIDRKALGKIAFSSVENTEKLNSAVFPIIIKELKKRISKIKEGTIIIDAPTLFESGADKLCNFTVAVLAERNIRRSRILKRDNIDEEYADLRMSAEKDDDYFKQKADCFIYNNGNIEDLTEKFLKIFNSEVS